MPKRHHESGFSLVEIALVLLIIGVIIGGVLKGQDLLDSARIKATIVQINDYKMAVASFQDRYDALPGDYHKAQETFGGNVVNGNNDGAFSGDEGKQFWQHLIAAGLISAFADNQTEPSTKAGGKLTVVTQDGENWYRLGSSEGNDGMLTPQQAMAIDKSLDNGDPKTGAVRSDEGSRSSASRCLTPGGKYQLDNKEKSCIVRIKF